MTIKQELDGQFNVCKNKERSNLMKQIIQNYKSGELQVVEIPSPSLKSGHILVKNLASLVSVGTEKSMLELAKKSLLGKARARPDLVKQVIAKIKAEGLIEAYKASMSRLDNPIPLGYSCAGRILEVGEGINEFKKGDRVACSGSGYASHAEVVSVPENLCVKIPGNVNFEEASFVALGGIALQAVRMANPSLGDKVAVIGLGLLGQLTVQILKASGCHVFGIDISKDKVEMAKKYGMDEGVTSGDTDILSASRNFASQGFDSVIIMAASKTNEPLETAAEIARERAKVVATGLIDLKIPRKSFFDKELELVVSRAWGPGVFNHLYIEKNIDYPYAYARWTAKRNLEEFLYLISKGKVKVEHLITHRFNIADALNAYELVLKGKEPYIGVIIQYPEQKDEEKEKKEIKPVFKKYYQKKIRPRKSEEYDKLIKAGFIGAGLFATGTLLPVIKRTKGIRLKGVATSTGLKAQHVSKKFGFEYFTTDYKEILNDNEIDLVFIMTRHGSHSHFICEVLKAGKNIFTEKPLCINEQQLEQIISVYNQKSNIDQKDHILMVGFNRRFSPFSIWLKEKLAQVKEPLSIHITCNAGYIPPDRKNCRRSLSFYRFDSVFY